MTVGRLLWFACVMIDRLLIALETRMHQYVCPSAQRCMQIVVAIMLTAGAKLLHSNIGQSIYSTLTVSYLVSAN